MDIKNILKIPKLTRIDMIAIAILVIFLILVTIPAYTPKNGCEVARPNFKCASFEDVMIENCEYWAQYECNTDADVSLPQVEWYIENLCKLQNSYHGTGIECSNLKSACNSITGSQLCPLGTFG